jgi:hypothetical protein
MEILQANRIQPFLSSADRRKFNTFLGIKLGLPRPFFPELGPAQLRSFLINAFPPLKGNNIAFDFPETVH